MSRLYEITYVRKMTIKKRAELHDDMDQAFSDAVKIVERDSAYEDHSIEITPVKDNNEPH